MTINCYKINSKLKLIPCDYEPALEAARNPNERVWFDVQGAEVHQLEALLDKLEVRDLTRRLCIESRGRSGFYPLHAFIFMVIPVPADTVHQHNVEYISILCQKNFLLTLRAHRESPLQQIATMKDSSDWLHDETIAGLVSTILMILSLDTVQRLSDLRDHIAELEERMERDPEEVKIIEIYDRRSKLLTLEAVISGQLPAFQALTVIDKPFFELENSREHLMSAVTNLQASDRSLHWLEGRLDSIRSDFEMRFQDKMNRRLSRLTVLSTIFMPITLLAGVWGMNFEDMPELNLRYGYMIAVGSMVLIGTGMYFYFRKKGWFE